MDFGFMTLFDYLSTNLVELAPGRCTSRADNSMALNIRRILGEPRRKGDLTDPCSRRLGVFVRRHPKVPVPGFSGCGTFCENRHSVATVHGPIRGRSRDCVRLSAVGWSGRRTDDSCS